MLVLCYSCNPAFYSLFDCRGWGTKCWISSEFTAFIPFFRVFSWIFLPFRSSFLPIVSSTLKHNFLFSSYILFYFGVLSNLYLIFRSCIPRTFSRIVTTPEYFRILLHRLFLGTTTKNGQQSVWSVLVSDWSVSGLYRTELQSFFFVT